MFAVVCDCGVSMTCASFELLHDLFCLSYLFFVVSKLAFGRVRSPRCAKSNCMRATPGSNHGRQAFNNCKCFIAVLGVSRMVSHSFRGAPFRLGSTMSLQTRRSFKFLLPHVALRVGTDDLSVHMAALAALDASASILHDLFS